MSNELAGPELDKLVFEKLGRKDLTKWFDGPNGEPPGLSTDIGEAWRIMRYFEFYNIQSRLTHWWVEGEMRWHCEAWPVDGSFPFQDAEGDTAPLAICLTALKVAEARSG